jgi:tRNA A-37 threonylcarbamoyl transferase component Bud32
VLKLYESGRWRTEADTLAMALHAGIAVPEVVELKEKALLMNFIPGPAVNDFLEADGMEDMVLAVAGWLAAFHRAFREGEMVRLKSDAIFKNFIVSDRLYGIDFELSRMGRPEEDAGEALAYLLDTRPVFTEKKFELGRKFIERYEKESGIVLNDIDDHVAISLEEAAEFRPAQAEALKKKAAEIRLMRPFER